MELQIQDLVSSIKKDGTESANREAAQILAEAKAQAEKIVADARSEADKLRADAQAEIGVFKASAQLSAEQAKRDAVLAFRQEIGAELTKLLAQDTHKALDDKALAARITAALQGEDAAAYAAPGELRYAAVRLIHAPLVSLGAHQWFTDTTNAYRAYSREYLTPPDVRPLRDVFGGYELLAYLSIRATQLGLKACEVPVTRAYPATGKTPTKISGFKGNSDLMKVLLNARAGKYIP